MLTKAELFNRYPALPDLSRRDDVFLVIRTYREKMALIIAERDMVRCSAETISALALETFRLCFPGVKEREGIVIEAVPSAEAMEQRDEPIVIDGSPRFRKGFELISLLDGVRVPVERVLGGLRGGIWPRGSDDFGFPSEPDLADMLSSGMFPPRAIRLAARYRARRIENLLRALCSFGGRNASLAMAVLYDMTGELDVSGAIALAANIEDQPGASRATKLVAKAAYRGDAAALAALFGLARNDVWRTAIQPSWASGQPTTREELLRSIRRQFENRFRSGDA